MNLLFDQNITRNLRQYLTAHSVKTAAQMGWEKLENGDLLKAAEIKASKLWSPGIEIWSTS